MFVILLCSFGSFDSAINTFDSHSHYINVQRYYSTNLCIALHLNQVKNSKIFEVKMMTSSSV